MCFAPHLLLFIYMFKKVATYIYIYINVSAKSSHFSTPSVNNVEKDLMQKCLKFWRSTFLSLQSLLASNLLARILRYQLLSYQQGNPNV